jgi:simple sugar transport system ATP-binding protein
VTVPAVAIARAVYFKRRILLLDGPTSALSVRETEAVLNYIKQLRAENVSSVLVTHNLYHAYQVCDRFVVMSHGQKVYDVAKGDTSIEELTRHVVLTLSHRAARTPFKRTVRLVGRSI